MKSTLIRILIVTLLGQGGVVTSVGAEPLPPVEASPGAAHPSAPPATLAERARAIENEQGVRMVVPAKLGEDPLPATKAGALDLAELLKGYNWLGTHAADGRLTSVTLTGRQGSGPFTAGDDTGTVASRPILQRRSAATLPARYADLTPGSVIPVDIDTRRLRGMKPGSRISLDLPDGRHDYRHDRAWSQGGGDRSWAAQTEDAHGDAYRALLTLGEGQQINGQIQTPQGRYWLESDANGQWLIDLQAAGLQPGLFESTEPLPIFPAYLPPSSASGSKMSASPEEGRDFSPAPTSGERADIDILFLVTGEFAQNGGRLRIHQRLATANQAMVDSGAPVRLKLAGIEPTTYANQGDNRQALHQLTRQEGAFREVARLRSHHQADLVLLVRAFDPGTQGNACGEAWVNGAGGLSLSPELAYGVVNDGFANGYYCSPYTLAHEVGHLLGVSHDREHATLPGHFDYAYGYGQSGRFGDIMSYHQPEVGLFANPALARCFGLPCGIAIGQPGAADVVGTFRKTAGVVAHFMRTRGVESE